MLGFKTRERATLRSLHSILGSVCIFKNFMGIYVAYGGVMVPKDYKNKTIHTKISMGSTKIMFLFINERNKVIHMK